MFEPFCYRAWAKRLDWKTGQLTGPCNHDGDSTWLFLDLGVYGYQAANCRLWGINAPEMNDKDETVRAKAAMARDALRAMIDGKHVFVLSKGLDKYGRPLVVIWENVGDYPAYDKSVNAKLVRQGLAKEYVL